MFSKIAENQKLRPEELASLKRDMKKRQLTGSYLSGIQSGRGDLFGAIVDARSILSGGQTLSDAMGFFSANSFPLNNTTTKVTGTTQYFNKTSRFTISSGEVFVRETGLYRIIIFASWLGTYPTSNVGLRKIQCVVMSSPSERLTKITPASASGPTKQNAYDDFIEISANQSFYVNVYQNSGDTIGVIMNMQLTKMSDNVNP